MVRYYIFIKKFFIYKTIYICIFDNLKYILDVMPMSVSSAITKMRLNYLIKLALMNKLNVNKGGH